ncbi:MAG: ornithine carbamoyltransferase [Anaerolineaceae bacterium]|nr:ornithine carbamoyltransferase [Anaerolineaceae bacterium]MDE0329293.1 ornithine carbamoyltransferase [Anaerolineaceae bacterium]
MPRDFLDLAEWTSVDLQRLLRLAVELKSEWRDGGNRQLLAGLTLGMIFQKASLRTRVSFEVGMNHLGGHAIMLGEEEVGLGKRESVADVARVLSGMVQGIMARVYDHQDVVDLAAWASVPVINGLSDDRHPCQALSDMLTISEHFGRTEGLRLCYLGDGNNIAASLALACAHFGLDFTISSPEGYALDEEVLADAEKINPRTDICLQSDPDHAVAGADILYTDTWVSMGQEEEAAERRQVFRPWQLNAALLARAPSQAVVMHDLPAYRGKEITDEVADSERSLIFPQAANRLHAQKAILVDLMGTRGVV